MHGMAPRHGHSRQRPLETSGGRLAEDFISDHTPMRFH